jgi:hypothetical protein
MNYTSRFSPIQGIVLIAIIGLVLFFVGFWLARSTTANTVSRDRAERRYEFLPVGDTVAAVDIYTGEAYAIDGNTRAWTVLAPALPAAKPAK